jgi:hypothetical protein
MTVGTILILPQLGLTYIGFRFSVSTLETHGGCVTNYSPFLPWSWFGTMVPLNILTSAVFSYVAYQQYKLFGSDAWKRLAKDGTQTTCLVIVCNVTCGWILIFEIGGDFSEMSFIADW